MADLRITDLPVLPEADVAATDVIPVADVSASETKKVTTKDLIEAGVALIDNGSIPAAKLSAISPASLGTSTLAAQFIAGPTATTGTFAARVIAAGDLPIATAAVTGTVSVGAGLAVTGGGALSVAASTSATIGGISVPTASGLTVSGAGVVSHISSVTAQSRNGFTISDSGHITAIGTIPAGDLPIATTAAVGGVLIGSGLAVTGGGQLNHASTLSAGTTSGITFNETGHITATTALVGADIPVATASTRGAVSVPAGALEVDGAGALTHENSGVTPGTYAKVTVDARGHVTASSTLIAADIPAISATALTSGTIDVARFGTNSITGNKLANQSTVLFGGSGSTVGEVIFPAAQYTGQYFFDALNGDLYLWDGNAWQPITITAGEIVFAGTYNANTNLVASVTTAGSAAGLTVGSALPAAAAANSRYYVVVSISGTGTAPAPTVALAPPDMLLSNGAAWQEIDVSGTVAAQIASNISFTPTGAIAATNVQTALVELDDEKLAKAGGTITGEVLIANTGSIVFEGATADAFETSLTVVDPTADRTITLPNSTGTLITTGDTGAITSSMILDGTIVNGDINASAAIAFSKLAALTSAHLLVGNASNVAAGVAVTGDISIDNAGITAIASGVIVNADVNASAAIAGSKIQAATTSNAGAVQLTDSTSSTSITTAATPNAVKSAYDLANAALPTTGGTLTGNVTLNAQSDLRFADSDSSNWVAFQSPATVAANVTWTLPAADGTSAQVLSTNGSGTLSWTSASSGDVTLTGTQTLTNKTLTDPAITGTILEDVFTITDGAAFEVDPGNGSIQLITLGASRTPKATNMAAGESVTLMVNDGTAYTLTWTDATWGSGGVKWTGGTAPTLATTGYTVLQFWKVSTQVYGAFVGNVA